MTEQVLGLARFLFDRQANSYDADPEEVNLAWMTDGGIRDFWLTEARAVLAWLWLTKDAT
jgi:hypothetical protein